MPAQQGRQRSFFGPTFVVLVLLVATTACEPALRPFRPHDKSVENKLLTLSTSAGLSVATTRGVESAIAERFAEAVVAALGRLDLPASTAEPASRAIHVESQAVISESENASPTLIIRWTLTDPNTAVSNTLETQLPIDPVQWKNGTPEVLEHVAALSARDIAGLIHGAQPEIAGSPAPVTMAITGVDGASSDDSRVLVLAFRTVLEESGVPIVDDPADAVATLHGAIEVSAASANGERILIVWTLSDAGGRTVGTLRQDNTVRKGELAARWGELVFDIAFAAADAIVEILKQIDAAEKLHRIGAEETLK